VPIAPLDCIRPAFEHAEQQLFRPFRFGQWWRLALVVFLTGEVGGGGCNYNIPSGPGSPSSTTATSAPVDFPALGEYLWLIALIVVCVILLGIVLLAVGSVFRFILYESVVERRCLIKQSWRRWQSAGLRFFVWQVVLMLTTLVLMSLVVGVPLLLAYRSGWFSESAAHAAGFIVMAVAVVLLVTSVVITVLIVRMLVQDFAVPVMALEDVGVFEAWRQARRTIVPSRKELAIYVLVKGLFAILAAIGFAIIGLIGIILLVIVMGIPTLLVALGLAAAGIGWNFATITLLVVAGLLFFAAIVFLSALISVPRTVFFVAFSQRFVADRYPALAEWRGRAAQTIAT
jgi:hypothetical protein